MFTKNQLKIIHFPNFFAKSKLQLNYEAEIMRGHMYLKMFGPFPISHPDIVYCFILINHGEYMLQ